MRLSASQGEKCQIVESEQQASLAVSGYLQLGNLMKLSSFEALPSFLVE